MPNFPSRTVLSASPVPTRRHHRRLQSECISPECLSIAAAKHRQFIIYTKNVLKFGDAYAFVDCVPDLVCHIVVDAVATVNKASVVSGIVHAHISKPKAEAKTTPRKT
jgi:hypothetical protein